MLPLKALSVLHAVLLTDRISPAASKSFMVVCPSKMCAGDRCDINLLNVEPNPKNEKFLARFPLKISKFWKIFDQKRNKSSKISKIF